MRLGRCVRLLAASDCCSGRGRGASPSGEMYDVVWIHASLAPGGLRSTAKHHFTPARTSSAVCISGPRGCGLVLATSTPSSLARPPEDAHTPPPRRSHIPYPTLHDPRPHLPSRSHSSQPTPAHASTVSLQYTPPTHTVSKPQRRAPPKRTVPSPQPSRPASPSREIAALRPASRAARPTKQLSAELPVRFDGAR
jgi:hypothetical protein